MSVRPKMHLESTYEIEKDIRTITLVFPEGLGRGVPMYTRSSPVCF